MRGSGGRIRPGAWEAITGSKARREGPSRRFSRESGDRAEGKASELSSTTTAADWKGHSPATSKMVFVS